MKTIALLLTLMATAALAEPVTDPFGGKPTDGFTLAPTAVDGMWIREQADTRGIKHIINGRFTLSYVNHKTRIISHHMIGVLAEEKGKLKEMARYVTPNWTEFLERKRLSKFESDSPNAFTQAGYDRRDEVWIRTEPHPPAIILQGIPDFSDERTELDGIWMLDSTQGWRALKIFDRGRFSVTHYDGKTKQVTRHMTGVYSFDGTTLREKALYATENWKELIDRVFTQQMKIQPGENLTQTAGDGYTESYRWVLSEPDRQSTSIDRK